MLQPLFIGLPVFHTAAWRLPTKGGCDIWSKHWSIDKHLEWSPQLGDWPRREREGWSRRCVTSSLPLSLSTLLRHRRNLRRVGVAFTAWASSWQSILVNSNNPHSKFIPQFWTLWDRVCVCVCVCMCVHVCACVCEEERGFRKPHTMS